MSNEYICPDCGNAVDEMAVRLREIFGNDFSGCPFMCTTCASVLLKWRAVRDLTFVWPMPKPKTYIEGGVIERLEAEYDPEDELHGRTSYGILLSQGSGYWSNSSNCCNAPVLPKHVPTCKHCEQRCTYTYKFHPVAPLLPGTTVVYDKFVPWRFYPKKPNGESELVVICGAADIKGVVKNT